MFNVAPATSPACVAHGLAPPSCAAHAVSSPGSTWTTPWATPWATWVVLPAMGAWSRRGRRARGRAVHAMGFGVQEVSAEEQEEYDKEKAIEAAEEAAARATDPQGPDKLSLARLRIWARSQSRSFKVNPGIAVQNGKLVASVPMEAGSPLIGVRPAACLRALPDDVAEEREEAALQLAWRAMQMVANMEGGPTMSDDEEPWPTAYLEALEVRPPQPLLWNAEEVCELQDLPLQMRIKKLTRRVDKWFKQRCVNSGMAGFTSNQAFRLAFRAGFASFFAKSIQIDRSWVLVPFLDAIEPMGLTSEQDFRCGNCKVEVEEIAPQQQLVVLSATRDLKEGDVLVREIEPQLSPADVLLHYGTVLPADSVVELSAKAYLENAPDRLQRLPGLRPGRLPGDVSLAGCLRPHARYPGEDGTRLDDLKAMVDDVFLKASLVLANEELEKVEVEDFVNLTGRAKLQCLEMLRKVLVILAPAAARFAGGIRILEEAHKAQENLYMHQEDERLLAKMIANHPELSPEYQGIKGIMMDDAHKVEDKVKMIFMKHGIPPVNKEDTKLLTSAKGCRRLAVAYRHAQKTALALVIEEVEEALARAQDGGGMPFALRK
ncbi:unnamed protein product [Durusdinium trenchii]|uniref:Rubisco LSMT substrate-binding domain-containing protein n=1 Tax=Durusdinium trenchii TaxID=1381693 RepID=A0ABP0J4Y6_9DINO